MGELKKGIYTVRFSEPKPSYYEDYGLQSMIVIEPPFELQRNGFDFVTDDGITLDHLADTSPSERHPRGTSVYLALAESENVAATNSGVEVTVERLLGIAAITEIEGYHEFEAMAASLGETS